MPQPPKRVLCVEDNQDIGFLLYTVLKGEGFDAVITYTVPDALMLAGQEEFDLYVLNATFGSGSGFDLCRTLREAHPEASVICRRHLRLLDRRHPRRRLLPRCRACGGYTFGPVHKILLLLLVAFLCYLLIGVLLTRGR